MIALWIIWKRHEPVLCALCAILCVFLRLNFRLFQRKVRKAPLNRQGAKKKVQSMTLKSIVVQILMGNVPILLLTHLLDFRMIPGVK